MLYAERYRAGVPCYTDSNGRTFAPYRGMG